MAGDIDQIDEEFWSSLDSLDREALVRDTVETIHSSNQPLSLAGLAQRLPPTHDLESLAVWLGLAREADCTIGEERETLDLTTRDDQNLRFHVPLLVLDPAMFENFEWEP
ncbi:DUF3375 family protein [Thermomonas sp. HDW16]|uniref:DUF3375 family protein n=1 Tax=Thermomonas sp. HDW16 TaxID=2714945 RepID=UPI0021055062|nr:DUF3375 family protein [Thermomonas sp. HDW16]